MKIIQINASYKPAFIYGGPTMSVAKLSEVLVTKGIQLEVLTTTANGKNELDVITGRSVVIENVAVTYFKRLTKDHTHFSPALYKALNKKLSKKAKSASQKIKKNTLVHIHTWWNFVSVFSCFIAHFKKIEVVLSPRGTLSSYSFSNRNNFIKNIIYKLSKSSLERCHFHVTSENEKRAILALVQPKSITVIPNLVNLPQMNSSNILRDKEGPIKLLFFSRVEQKKGLELLFTSLKNININYSLTIGGSGDTEYIDKLKHLSISLRIDDKISWIGQQPTDKKFGIMTQHDLLVLPSYDENFANVVIESLASGTAVLITQNVGLSDYVLNNNLGWVCKLDSDAVRESLIEANYDKKKLEKIRNHAPAKIRTDFSDEKISHYYIEMYTRILSNV